MELLSSNSYFPVVASKKPYKFFCKLENYKDLIELNVKFIKFLESQKDYPMNRYLNFFSTDFSKVKKFKIKNLEEIFLNANCDQKSFIKTQDEFNKFYEDKLITIAENFQGDDERVNLGAGRNILLHNLELKGVGRTQLATRLDYNHAWGGMRLMEAIIEFLITNIVHYSSISKTEQAIAIGIEQDNSDPSPNDNAILIRRRTSPRISMCNKEFESEKSINTIKKYFKNKFLIENHILNYFNLSFNGMLHRSYILENSTLSGSIIDCNSISFSAEKNAIIGTLLIKPVKYIKIKKNEDLFKLKNCKIENNSIRNFYLLIKTLIKIKKKNINPRQDLVQDKLIFNILKQIVSKKDQKNIFNLLNNLILLDNKPLHDFQRFESSYKNKSLIFSEVKEIKRSLDTVLKVDYIIPLKIKVPNLLLQFNRSQYSNIGKFILDFPPVMNIIKVNSNSMTNLLMKEVIKYTQVPLYRLDASGKVKINSHPKKDLNKLINEYKSKDYYCHFIVDEKLESKWMSKIEIQKLENEFVISAYKIGLSSHPMLPIYFI